MAENYEPRVKAAHAGHAGATDRANQALPRLDRHGEEISCSAVAKAALVSRSWLYRQPQLRAQIEQLRSTHRPASRRQVTAAQQASPASLLRRVEALQEQATRLSTQNQASRDQLARKLGSDRHAALGRTHLQ
jgi:Family of unknown function (DUF6262)